MRNHANWRRRAVTCGGAVCIATTLFVAGEPCFAQAADAEKDDAALLRELERSVDQKEKKRPVPKKRLRKAAGGDEAELRDLESSVDTSQVAAQVAQSRTSAMGRFIQSMNPNISLIGTFAAAYFGDRSPAEKPAVPIGGHDPKESGFQLQEVELAFQAAVDPYFRMDAFFSFFLEGVEVEEAYFSTIGLPGGLQVRAGYFNQKFGRQNRRHLHEWQFADNMLANVRLLGTDSLRTVAVETSWLPKLPWYLEVNLSIGMASGEMVPSFIGAGERAERFDFEDPRHLLYLFHLAQQFDLSVDWALAVGLTYALGPNGSGGYPQNYSHLFGGDLFLKYRPLREPFSEIRFTVEGYGRLLQIPEGSLFDWGLYAMLRFRLGRRWYLALRYDVVEIEDAGKLAQFGFASLPADGEGLRPVDDQNRFSVALTWQPTEYSQIRLQYNNNWIRRTTAAALPGRYGQVHEVFVQFMGNIGSHGAHPF